MVKPRGGVSEVLLPQRVYAELNEIASSRDMAVEEVVLEALSPLLKGLELDPKGRRELHLKLCEKYLREAEEFLGRGDGVEAGEKAWGAAAQMLKAVAARRGRKLRSHSMLWEFVEELSVELEDEELLTLWHVANSLHVNFYESWATLHAVERGLEDIKRFVRKLKKVGASPPPSASSEAIPNPQSAICNPTTSGPSRMSPSK